ncbi:MAG: UPF0179 family protein [Thermoplasmata archaeon]|nr:UPF0179 family protein [Thermoplasmata archaeon]
MVLVTLIGERQVKEGNEFVYTGPLSECKDCRLKGVCFNLEEGKRYRISSVRRLHHTCRVHEDGVRVVEVETVAVDAVVSVKSAVEGSMVTLEFPKCGEIGCEHYRLCHPLGLKDRQKATIIEVKKKVNCPRKRPLKRVKLA